MIDNPLRFLRKKTILIPLLVGLFIAALSIVSADAQVTILSQPMTVPGDPHPCDLWYAWCNPATWPSNYVYAAPWDDADAPGFWQILAENFVLNSTTKITEIKIWGGYWWQDIAPANDNFTLIFHNDAGSSIGTKAAEPGFTTSRDDGGATWVNMKWCLTCSGNALVFEYTFTMNDPVILDPGTYWVEIYNDTTGHLVNNDFFWVWGYLDETNGIDGLAWMHSNEGYGCNVDWCIDSEGNLAIEITGKPIVAIDIKPQSCPNPLNVGKKGVTPVAILGTYGFDVTTIDPETILLEGVSPLRWSLKDVSTPFEPFIGKEYAYDCTEAGPDGYLDLTIKFNTQDIVAALGAVSDRDVKFLRLTGNLFDGTSIEGEDVIIILKKK